MQKFLDIILFFVGVVIVLALAQDLQAGINDWQFFLDRLLMK